MVLQIFPSCTMQLNTLTCGLRECCNGVLKKCALITVDDSKTYAAVWKTLQAPLFLLLWRGTVCHFFKVFRTTNFFCILVLKTKIKMHFRKKNQYLKFEPNITRKGIARPCHNPSFHIHVSVSDLHIPTIDLPILLQEISGPIMGIYESLTDTWMWKLGLRPRNSQKRNT